MAFPICYFPPHLSDQGGLDDPGTFLLVPPGYAGDMSLPRFRGVLNGGG
jgi:hypothetical protein